MGTNKGVTPEERERLFKTADITDAEQDAFLNLFQFGVSLQKEAEPSRGFFSKLRGSNRKDRSNEPGYELSRYTPRLKKLLSDALADNLSTSSHPFVRDGGAQPTAGAAQSGTGKSHRSKARGVM